MLLRRGVGRVKHLSTKQLWVQGAIESYEIKIKQLPRALNNADLFTHVVSREALCKFMQFVGFRTGSLPPVGE